jgi:hypothetical protein
MFDVLTLEHLSIAVNALSWHVIPLINAGLPASASLGSAESTALITSGVRGRTHRQPLRL